MPSRRGWLTEKSLYGLAEVRYHFRIRPNGVDRQGVDPDPWGAMGGVLRLLDVLNAQIERLAEQLAEDDQRELMSLFVGSHATQPQLLWNPQAGQLPAPEMAALLAIWEARGGRRRLAAADDCFGGELAGMRERLVQVVVDDAGHLTYAYTGAEVAKILGQDYTGRTMADVLARDQAPDIVFYAAGYKACERRHQPYMTFNESPRLKARAVSRLVVPFWDLAGRVRVFLTLPVEVDRRMPATA